MANRYGYTGYYKPPKLKAPTLATAAAGHPTAADPFGLLGRNAGAAPGSAPAISYGTPAKTVAPSPHPAAPAAVPPTAAPISPTPAPTPGAYDINTDPALQTVTALTGLSDEQARAAALKQKQDQLLAYGDPNLAQGLLGDATLAQAASQNPTSQLAQLGQQRDRNTHDLTEGLNKQNLLYSGYRVSQEEQAAKDYQNALAQAASGVNSNLGAIDSQLAQALGQSQAQRLAAMQAAYANHATDPGYDPSNPGGGTGVDTAALTTGLAVPDSRASGLSLDGLSRLIRSGGFRGLNAS